MDATTVTARPWNYYSEVRCCETCNGLGCIPSSRKATVDDPYPDMPCPDCDGEHLPECEVCGFTQQIHGFDCLACQTAYDMSDQEAAAFDVQAFAKALSSALGARRAAK